MKRGSIRLNFIPAEGEEHLKPRNIRTTTVLKSPGGQLGEDLLPICKAFPKETTTRIWFTQSHRVLLILHTIQ